MARRGGRRNCRSGAGLARYSGPVGWWRGHHSRRCRSRPGRAGRSGLHHAVVEWWNRTAKRPSRQSGPNQLLGYVVHRLPGRNASHRAGLGSLPRPGLDVIGVDFREGNKAAMQRFPSKVGAKFTAALDPDGKIADAYGVTFGLPTSVFVDRDGTVRVIHLGQMAPDFIDQQALSLL